MAATSKLGCVTVFGGTGFLGGQLVKRLAAEGITVRVAARRPDNAGNDVGSGRAGEIQPIYADVRDETSLAAAMNGCDAVINAVGLYVERRAETFEAVHELGALNVAHQCATFAHRPTGTCLRHRRGHEL